VAGFCEHGDEDLSRGLVCCDVVNYHCENLSLVSEDSMGRQYLKLPPHHYTVSQPKGP
jgi:hypothetical protein